MTAPQIADDDFTELTDAQIDRVDLVGAPANGRAFLIRKAAEQGDLNPGLVPADLIRDILKSDAQEGAPVTDPAPVEKAELDVTDAPAADDLIPDAPGGTTAATVPGSPDWEKLDGDTAMNAVAVLGRLKSLLGWLADREAQEAVTGGDADAGDNAWDLDDMGCAIDAMIGRLAGFAVGEHMEADELEAVGKSVAAVVEPLAVVEGLAPIAKAGRTLSAANESKIRAAVDSLTGVLNSLPQATAEEPVTKETAVPETPAAETAEDRVAKGEHPVWSQLMPGATVPVLTARDAFAAVAKGGSTVEIAKAAGDPQLAVFDADGKLIGTIDPSKLSPIATSPAAAAPAEEASEGDVEPADEPAAPADPAAAPADPATEATIPGTATVQSPPEQDPNAVAKAAALAALEEFLPTLTEEVRKNADLAGVVKGLEEQVRKMGQQPDNRRSPVLNGATGAGPVSRDGTQDDSIVALEKAVADAKTDGEKRDALQQLAFAKIGARFER